MYFSDLFTPVKKPNPVDVVLLEELQLQDAKDFCGCSVSTLASILQASAELEEELTLTSDEAAKLAWIIQGLSDMKEFLVNLSREKSRVLENQKSAARFCP